MTVSAGNVAARSYAWSGRSAATTGGKRDGLRRPRRSAGRDRTAAACRHRGRRPRCRWQRHRDDTCLAVHRATRLGQGGGRDRKSVVEGKGGGRGGGGGGRAERDVEQRGV